MNSHQAQQQNLSGAHPATVDDVNRTGSLTQTSHPVEGASNNNANVMMKNPGNNTGASAVSSTPSEYGSDDSNSRRSSGSSPRPVADKNAFIKSNEVDKHWQNNMTPAERAKQLGEEMDQTLKERRKSSSSSNSQEKTMKIAGKKANIN